MKHVYKIILKLIALLIFGFLSMALGAIGIIGFLHDKDKKEYGFSKKYIETISKTFGL